MIKTAVVMEQVIISTPFHKLQSDNVMKLDLVAFSDLMVQGAITLFEGLSDIGDVSIVSKGIGIGKRTIRSLSSKLGADLFSGRSHGESTVWGEAQIGNQFCQDRKRRSDKRQGFPAQTVGMCLMVCCISIQKN
jgi:hypothetical protein